MTTKALLPYFSNAYRRTYSFFNSQRSGCSCRAQTAGGREPGLCVIHSCLGRKKVQRFGLYRGAAGGPVVPIYRSGIYRKSGQWSNGGIVAKTLTAHNRQKRNNRLTDG